MDSLTQIALGSATAALVAPRQHRRLALAAVPPSARFPILTLSVCPFLGLTRLLLSRGTRSFTFLARVGRRGMASLVTAAANMATGPGSARTLVGCDRTRLADSSTSRRVHCLRNAAILATAGATDNGGEHFYHRPALHRSTTRGLSGCLVVASSSLRDVVFVRGTRDKLGVSRVVSGGKGDR